MAQALPYESHDGLSHNFNTTSNGWVHGLHWGHVGLMVLGMTFPMVATAVPLAGMETFGDIVVQFGHSVMEMANNAIEHTLPVLDAAWSNALDGNFAPSTYEAGSMHIMEEGTRHIMPDGSIMENPTAALETAAIAGVDPHLTVARDWYWGLDTTEQFEMMEEAAQVGMSFDDYLLSICPVDPQILSID